MILHRSPPNELLGIVLKILSGLCMSVMAALIKYLGDMGGAIPLGELVFFRSAVALIPLVMFLMWTNDFPSGLYTKHPFRHIIRCVLGTLAMFSAFKAISLLPLAEYTALFYLSPIFLVFFAMFMLKEQISKRRWLGVALGLSGLAILTVPNFSLDVSFNALLNLSTEQVGSDSDNQSLQGIGLAVFSAIMAAAAMLQVRQLTQMGENAGAIAFYFALTSSVIAALATFSGVFHNLVGGWVAPEPWQLVLLLIIGFFGGIAQILLTLAFKYAEASALASYDYLAIVWAVIIGFLAFAEVPDRVFWLAMPLILLGAVVAKPKTNHNSLKNH